MEAGQYVFDLNRIFLGRLPWEYLLEILFRCTVIYIYALIVVRMLGKRGMGQLAPFDFVIIIALGSAVGDPMFYPDVPLLHALLAITAIVLFTRVLVRLTQNNPLLERFVSTTSTRLVKDGVMDLHGMRQEGISREELFEALRNGGIGQLGQVERAYLEPSGHVSTFRQPPNAVRLGLPLLPEKEMRGIECAEYGQTAKKTGQYSCCECGLVVDVAAGTAFNKCASCGGQRWTRAIERVHELLAPLRLSRRKLAKTDE